MFNVLEDLVKQPGGRRDYLGSDVYRAGFCANIEKVKNFYRSTNSAVDSAHLLVRLLQNIPINYESSVKAYYDEISDIAYDIAGSMFITSPFHVGRSSKPWLLGDGYDELPIAVHPQLSQLETPTLLNGFRSE